MSFYLLLSDGVLDIFTITGVVCSDDGNRFCFSPLSGEDDFTLEIGSFGTSPFIFASSSSVFPFDTHALARVFGQYSTSKNIFHSRTIAYDVVPVLFERFISLTKKF